MNKSLFSSISDFKFEQPIFFIVLVVLTPNADSLFAPLLNCWPCLPYHDVEYKCSYSKSWLDHCKLAAKSYKEMFNIGMDSSILEIGSNDGYFLKYFNECSVVLGVEPTKVPGKAAIKDGVKTKIDFFNDDVAVEIIEDHGQFDLILSNNMLAHTPDLMSVLSGVRRALNEDGKFIVEVQYAADMFLDGKFDTVYHEHFCYYTINSALNVFEKNGLYISDVERLSTHGGSIRLYASKQKVAQSDRLKRLIVKEIEQFSVGNIYRQFFEKAKKSKNNFLKYISDNGPIVCYGAPTKGNVFLNYCGVTFESIKFTCDMSPLKQNRYCPGSGIPIHSVNKTMYKEHSAILILPWNIKTEVIKQFNDYGIGAKKFITTIPELEIT